ncbi:MAG: TIGR00282 family metallophosphoesterase [Planctomycetota bacterium]
MRLLFIGDIVGKPGRDIVVKAAPRLRAALGLDLIVANAENAAGGSGLTPAIYRDLIDAGVDAVTLGDHVYRRKEIYPILRNEERIVRPANLPPEAVGSEWAVVEARDGTRVAVFCLLGQLFMKPMDNPWRAADRVLAQLPTDVSVRFLDFHVEATSEAQLMGRYLEGRVSAVLGTHTHVATADERVLEGGTAFQCDVGMTGPHDSILGRRVDRVMETQLTAHPTQFEVATGDVQLCGAIVDIDPASGRALAIERVRYSAEEINALPAEA